MTGFCAKETSECNNIIVEAFFHSRNQRQIRQLKRELKTEMCLGPSLWKQCQQANGTIQINAQTMIADTGYLSNYVLELHLEAVR